MPNACIRAKLYLVSWKVGQVRSGKARWGIINLCTAPTSKVILSINVVSVFLSPTLVCFCHTHPKHHNIQNGIQIQQIKSAKAALHQ